MPKIVHSGITAAAALIFATSGGNELANNATATQNCKIALLKPNSAA